MPHFTGQVEVRLSQASPEWPLIEFFGSRPESEINEILGGITTEERITFPQGLENLGTNLGAGNREKRRCKHEKQFPCQVAAEHRGQENTEQTCLAGEGRSLDSHTHHSHVQGSSELQR